MNKGSIQYSIKKLYTVLYLTIKDYNRLWHSTKEQVRNGHSTSKSLSGYINGSYI